MGVIFHIEPLPTVVVGDVCNKLKGSILLTLKVIILPSTTLVELNESYASAEGITKSKLQLVN